MTFDLLKYSEDRISAEEAIPDELLGDALSIIIASADTELGRDGAFYITVTEEEVVRALREVNLLDAQERFYSYCDGLGIVVDISFRGFSSIPYVELTWTVQSLKEAKAENTKENKAMRNSREEPLLPIGSVVTFVEKSRPESYLRYTIVRHIALEGSSYPDHYVIERNGNFREVHYSEVTLVK